MDVPTIYVDEPDDEHEAWRQLARLLPKITALFSLIAAATDEDKLQNIYHAAKLGEELSDEAYERADTLSDFTRPWTEEKATAALAEEKSAADPSEEVSRG